jgi:hypothetical protein
LQFEKNVFSLLLGWFCISKMIYKAWEALPIAF